MGLTEPHTEPHTERGLDEWIAELGAEVNEDDVRLCAVANLTDDQLAGLDALVAMTAKQQRAFVDRVDRAWEAKVADVQAAKRDLAEASGAYTQACHSYARAIAPFRARLLMRQLTQAEAEIEAEAAAAVQAAYDAKTTAGEAMVEAQAMFKEPMTPEQLGA